MGLRPCTSRYVDYLVLVVQEETLDKVLEEHLRLPLQQPLREIEPDQLANLRLGREGEGEVSAQLGEGVEERRAFVTA